jgi:epsilon-lactone hydrolase
MKMMSDIDCRAQIDSIIAAIRSAPTVATAISLDDMRAAIDRQQGAYPVPPGVDFTPLTLGGVPALAAIPAAGEPKGRVLYLHGGGYVVGSLQGYRSLTAHLAARAGARVDSLGYRLAPEHPFPAALDDALAAYRAMLDETPPDRIAFAGDSAGGGLTLALLVAARDAGLPLPSGALMISPWADIDGGAEGSRLRNGSRDPLLTVSSLLSMRDFYVGAGRGTPPLASPLQADLSGLPPLMIMVGTAEILLDDSLVLARRAAEADVRVALEVRPHMFHGWHSRSATLWEADDTIDAAARFLSERLERGVSWECREAVQA